MKYSDLRPFQQEALNALESPQVPENHVVCVAATGSGKSRIYEKAMHSRGRRTLLVTPLVALARQQHQIIASQQVPVTLGAGGEREGPPSGETGAWIISPEMLQFQGRQNSLSQWKPNLLVVDECHCLWEWGEQFRPSFKLIPELLSRLQIKKSLWLTATLPYDARVQLRKLLPVAPIEVGGFSLPEQLTFFVHRVPLIRRAESLLSWILQNKGKGMIFVSSRQATLRLSRLIEATGKRVVAYHGGLSSEERKNIEAQVNAQIPDWIVTTSAFGMGMNYPHLTHVALWHLPTSILSLVQTIGRVGRGIAKQAQALVLWDEDDFQLLEWTIQNSEKRRNELLELKNFLNKDRCRLSALKEYFDRISIEPKCYRCDVCINS